MSTVTDEDTSMDIPNYNDPAYCKSEGVVVVTSFAYRSVQVLYSFIAGIAIFCVLRVYFRYIRASKLHTNIQKLLTLFLFAAVLINTSFIVMQSYQIFLSFAYRDLCDVFLPKHIYIVFNILYGFSLELYLLSKAMMTMERTIATIYVDSYERWRCSTGNLGVVMSILSAILVELYIYIGVSFKEPHISATSTPDEVTGRINEVLIFNVSCCTITMTIMIVLLLTNKKRKTKSIGCVSRRFQIDENIVTTEFIAKIAFVQLVAFSIQSLGGLILRSSLENFFTDNDLPALKSIKLSLQVMPIFTIIVCVVIEWSICRTTTRHRARVLSMVNIKDRGHHSLQFLSLQWSNTNLKLPQIERNTVC